LLSSLLLLPRTERELPPYYSPDRNFGTRITHAYP
jgi:hypothetical protein